MKTTTGFPALQAPSIRDALGSLFLVASVASGKLGIDRFFPALGDHAWLELRLWALIATVALMWRSIRAIDRSIFLRPFFLAFTALVAYLIMRGIASPGIDSLSKQVDFVYLLAMAALMLCASRQQIGLMAIWAIAFAVTLFLMAALGVGKPELNGPGWAPIGGPTTFYRLEFLAFCLCWCIYRQFGFRFWWLAVLSGVLLFGTFASLSKIALPAAVLVLLAYAASQVVRREWTALLLLVCVSGSIYAVWHLAMADVMQQRIARAATTEAQAKARASGIGTDFDIKINYCVSKPPSQSNHDPYVTDCVEKRFLDRSSRLLFAAEALAGVWERPVWGNGLTTFEIHMPSPDTGEAQVYRYPHNVVLEVAFEAGLVGVALLLTAAGVLLAAAWRAARQEAVGAYVLGFLVFIGASTLVSGDFYDSRLFWLAAFALIRMHAWRASAPAGA